MNIIECDNQKICLVYNMLKLMTSFMLDDSQSFNHSCASGVSVDFDHIFENPNLLKSV